MRKAIEKTLLLAWMKFYPDFRVQPFAFLIQMGVGGSPLFFFLIAGSSTGFRNGIIGAMVAMVSYMSITSSVTDVVQDRYTKMREIIVAMPVKPVSYAFGLALASLFVSVPGLLLFMLIAAWLGLANLISILWSFVVIILCWICISMFGFVLSSRLANLPTATLHGIARLVSLGIVFVPPVYYPETTLGQFAWVCYIFPTSNAASLIRSSLGLSASSFELVVLRLLVLIGTAISFVLLVRFGTRWREK